MNITERLQESESFQESIKILNEELHSRLSVLVSVANSVMIKTIGRDAYYEKHPVTFREYIGLPDGEWIDNFCDLEQGQWVFNTQGASFVSLKFSRRLEVPAKFFTMSERDMAKLIRSKVRAKQEHWRAVQVSVNKTTISENERRIEALKEENNRLRREVEEGKRQGAKGMRD